MANAANTIASTLSFFEAAVPTPEVVNLTTQLGVHFEEIAEMLDELVGENPNTVYALAMAQTHMKMLAQHFKSVPGCATVPEENRINFLDSLCDQIVTAVGCGHMHRMDMDGAMAEVNSSNLSKFDDDGKPIFDDNQKIMKGPKYFKANLAPFV